MIKPETDVPIQVRPTPTTYPQTIIELYDSLRVSAAADNTAPIMTDHGSQFSANKAKKKKKDESKFETLMEHGIRYILNKVRTPSTYKLERLHGEL